MDGDTLVRSDRATDLHSVVGSATAAVLVVDLGTRSVVHANDVAQQLAPGLSLPVALEEWSDAAQLRDAAGTQLSRSHRVLTRLLRSEPVPGQWVSAERRSEMGAAREPLWVVGLPMTGAPMLDDHALVVFLSVRERRAAAAGAHADQDAQIRDRAVLATGLSFTVADARRPDLPLVWVNPAFTASTGYEFDEAVGRNCRFLQGPGTDRAEVARVRAALAAREPITATLLNYRKDGLAFWNQVTMTPILDSDGEVSHYVGVQSDVSGRIESDRQRDAALAAEHEARTRAEEAQARLELMAEASEQLSGELDVGEARTRLLQLLVPNLADMVLFFHVDDAGAITEHQSRHRDPGLEDITARYGTEVTASASRRGLLETLLGGRTYRLLTDVDSADGLALRAALLPDGPAREGFATLRIGSALVVGLPGRLGVRDVVVLSRTRDRAPFTTADAETAVDLGRRAGLILDNLRLYATQSLIAQTLQRSLLPRIPELPGVRIEAQYLASADGAEVGGDFYDVIELGAPGSPLQVGRRPFGLVVGDVSGHDVYAAAAMGQLKGLLQATATMHELGPAAVLEHIDRLLPALNSEPPIATMLFARFEPYDDDRWRVTMSTAGHPAPLLRHPDGRHEYLDPPAARGPLLGYGTAKRAESSMVLEPGSTLIAYTDGLIERRGESLDVGFGRLHRAAESAGDGKAWTGRALTDHLVDRLTPGAQRLPAGVDADDIVVVAVHLAAGSP
jgi:PAS domain S-box-containing protein